MAVILFKAATADEAVKGCPVFVHLVRGWHQGLLNPHQVVRLGCLDDPDDFSNLRICYRVEQFCVRNTTSLGASRNKCFRIYFLWSSLEDIMNLKDLRINT